MKFSDYKKVNGNNSGTENLQIDDKSANVLKNFLRGYEGRSKTDIVSEIVKVAEKNRKEGKLTDEDLDNFAATLSPMLNVEQKNELNKIISRLKTQ